MNATITINGKTYICTQADKERLLGALQMCKERGDNALASLLVLLAEESRRIIEVQK